MFGKNPLFFERQANTLFVFYPNCFFITDSATVAAFVERNLSHVSCLWTFFAHDRWFYLKYNIIENNCHQFVPLSRLSHVPFVLMVCSGRQNGQSFCVLSFYEFFQFTSHFPEIRNTARKIRFPCFLKDFPSHIRDHSTINTFRIV